MRELGWDWQFRELGCVLGLGECCRSNGGVPGHGPAPQVVGDHLGDAVGLDGLLVILAYRSQVGLDRSIVRVI